MIYHGCALTLTLLLLCIFALKKSIHLPFAPYILWILTLPFAYLVTILCWFTNPIACLFPVRQPNGRDELEGLWDLWNTHDAYVDEGYYGSYFGANTPQGHYDYDNSAWLRYKYRLKWLTRNIGYGWNYLLFSIPLGTGFQWKGRATIPFWFLGFTINDYNIGWKVHEKDTKAFYAMRIIGLRK